MNWAALNLADRKEYEELYKARQEIFIGRREQEQC